MKKIYKDFYGCTASIRGKRNGSAKLIVRNGNGKKTHDQLHINAKAAQACMRRLSDGRKLISPIEEGGKSL